MSSGYPLHYSTAIRCASKTTDLDIVCDRVDVAWRVKPKGDGKIVACSRSYSLAIIKNWSTARL